MRLWLTTQYGNPFDPDYYDCFEYRTTNSSSQVTLSSYIPTQYAATIRVYDHNGNPLSGIPFQLYVQTWYGDPLNPDAYICVKTGTSDSGGYLYLECLIDPDFSEGLDWIQVTLLDNNYTILSSQNTSSITSAFIFPVYNIVYDTDGDALSDNLELQLAEKFKPVLHKHSYDLQENLENFQRLLTEGSFTLKVDSDRGRRLHTEQIAGGATALHKWDSIEPWNWDTYGHGSKSTGVYNLDLDDAKRYEGAPVGQRPIYYHVYEENGYYYVQYWYYFGMNDIREQVTGIGENWHESDWEHVSIRVIQDSNGNYIPDKVDFQIHDGGMTIDAANCWWSPTNTPTYQNINWGYIENSHTHLHIWLGANAHSSNNRYEKVYKTSALGIDYQDRVDYEPSFYDLYFEYDVLIKMGEVTKQALVQCPDSGAFLEYHVYPLKNSIPWLAYVGRTGDFHDPPVVNIVTSPRMPTVEENHHDWITFSIGSPYYGNGSFAISWVVDNNVGD